MELNHLQKYLRSVEKRVRHDHPEVDPIAQLESFAESTGRSARNAWNAQAAEVDDRVSVLGGPKR